MANLVQSWRDEKKAVYLYKIMAEVEPVSLYQDLFINLGKASEEQASLWEKEAAKKGIQLPSSYRPDFRTTFVGRLVGIFGPRKLKMILGAMKVRGLSVYQGHPFPKSVEEIGARHRGTQTAGNLRAAVFGVNDGLVSNLSLIMGVAGAKADQNFILLAGLAGVLAGALSMAAGEYLSVRSQKEMFEYQIGLEKEELQTYPDEEAAELSLIYQARGLSGQDADRLAAQMIAHPEQGLDVLAKEELGLDPSRLSSPWQAAFFSFAAFGFGGMIPLIPFFVFKHTHTLLVSMIITGIALFGVGVFLSLYTGRKALGSAARMVAIGGGAGALTYLISRWLSFSF